MKKYLPLFLLALIFASSCKKGKSAPANGLTGIWELTKDYGGLAGGTRYYAKGNGTTLQFNADSSYMAYNKFQLSSSGTYQVVKNGIAIGQQKYDALYYNHSQYSTELRLQSDTLTIGIDYDDNVAYVYVRQ